VIARCVAFPDDPHQVFLRGQPRFFFRPVFEQHRESVRIEHMDDLVVFGFKPLFTFPNSSPPKTPFHGMFKKSRFFLGLTSIVLSMDFSVAVVDRRYYYRCFVVGCDNCTAPVRPSQSYREFRVPQDKHEKLLFRFRMRFDVWYRILQQPCFFCCMFRQVRTHQIIFVINSPG
jgi:hypothetical protein